ncbi:hypothetical protein SFRURICE_004206 [Spodoptera frugiperda]|uniref:SFRICE_003819 n=1 Tax=Spodoptera frugiperda TaxID=7108 RepID=A0A2H1W0W6_SPOFR|nr:hypothetical protein SFRURICE_004206 [Spodoptera frugiperda]
MRIPPEPREHGERMCRYNYYSDSAGRRSVAGRPASSVRARRCTAAARALGAEARALRFLDDVVALLRGDVAAAVRARAWPFAIGRRQPDRNYII